VPHWLLIAVGSIAIVGVVADCIRSTSESSPSIRQKQTGGGRNSTNNQAGRDIIFGDKP